MPTLHSDGASRIPAVSELQPKSNFVAAEAALNKEAVFNRVSADYN